MQHIDAGIDLLRLRQQSHPEWFRSDRICFIDTLLQALWRQHYPEFIKSGEGENGSAKTRILPPGCFDYFTGDLPVFCKSKKPWGLEIDEIYTALHMGGNHWVAIMISIPGRHVTVWDNILSGKTDEAVGAAVAPICEMFPYAMHVLAPAADGWPYALDRYTFSIDRSKDLPQNQQTGDCGVYCLKYIEFHSLGMPWPKYLCDRNIKQIRDKLAFDIMSELGRTGEEGERTEYALLDIYGN